MSGRRVGLLGLGCVLFGLSCGGARGRSNQPDGEVDAGLVALEIRRHLREIQQCYQRALDGDPTLAGRVEVQFDVDTDGVARDIHVRGFPGSRYFRQCVSWIIQRAQFPPAIGGNVSFLFPFNFHPADAPSNSPTALGAPR